jgi:hypothetical protein
LPLADLVDTQTLGNVVGSGNGAFKSVSGGLIPPLSGLSGTEHERLSIEVHELSLTAERAIFFVEVELLAAILT